MKMSPDWRDCDLDPSNHRGTDRFRRFALSGICPTIRIETEHRIDILHVMGSWDILDTSTWYDRYGVSRTVEEAVLDRGRELQKGLSTPELKAPLSYGTDDDLLCTKSSDNGIGFLHARRHECGGQKFVICTEFFAQVPRETNPRNTADGTYVPSEITRWGQGIEVKPSVVIVVHRVYPRIQSAGENTHGFVFQTVTFGRIVEKSVQI
eukprot:Opistho-2@91744